MNYKKHIQSAIKIAKENPNRFKLCAITLDKRGHAIAFAINEMHKSHPFVAEMATKCGLPDRIYLHAESSVLLKSNLDAHSLIVVRVKKNGELANAKPCKICDKIIGLSNVKFVVYSNKYGSITKERRY